MLKIIKKDVRNFEDLNIKNIDTIIHLANVANDPTVELDPILSWEINVLASKLIARHAVKNKVKKIIFLSSGSVYGVKKEKNVTEDLKLNPISLYNKTKMIAERVFLSYKDKIDIICIRPATVCGLSERLRLDLTVNKLTFDAFYKKKIFVNGGNQIRPNIHIKDMVRAYLTTLEKESALINGKIFNVGYDNQKVIELANIVKKNINNDIEIIKTKTNDNRSYHISSDKIKKELGFKNIYNIADAVKDIKNAFKLNLFNDSLNNEIYFNVKMMKKIHLQ